MTTSTTNATKPPGQTGTGLHVDINPYEMWKLQVSDTEYKPLDRWRPFQSILVCYDAKKEYKNRDGSLEIVPGFHHICEGYFKKSEYHGRNLQKWGPYVTKFQPDHDAWIFGENIIQSAQRIPGNWVAPSSEDTADLCEKAKNELSREQIIENVQKIAKEHAEFDYSPVQQGDIIFFDIRMAHQNTKTQESDLIRQVMYVGFISAIDEVNGDRIKEYKEARTTCKHPSDFPLQFADIESNAKSIENLPPLGEFERLLYGYDKYSPNFSLESLPASVREEAIKGQNLVTERHLAFFKRYGYVIIENVVARELIARFKQSTQQFLIDNGVNIDILTTPAVPQKIDWKAWGKMSGLFGGMLETFWLREMEEVRLDPVTYGLNAALISKTWCSGDKLFEHPFKASMNPYALWVYLDRQNLRFPITWESPKEQ